MGYEGDAGEKRVILQKNNILWRPERLVILGSKSYINQASASKHRVIVILTLITLELPMMNLI